MTDPGSAADSSSADKIDTSRLLARVDIRVGEVAGLFSDLTLRVCFLAVIGEEAISLTSSSIALALLFSPLVLARVGLVSAAAAAASRASLSLGNSDSSGSLVIGLTSSGLGRTGDPIVAV